MVITDPKGTLIEECGKMLAKGPPKRDKDGNVIKDKSRKVVYEPYAVSYTHLDVYKRQDYPVAEHHSGKRLQQDL